MTPGCNNLIPGTPISGYEKTNARSVLLKNPFPCRRSFRVFSISQQDPFRYHSASIRSNVHGTFYLRHGVVTDDLTKVKPAETINTTTLMSSVDNRFQHFAATTLAPTLTSPATRAERASRRMLRIQEARPETHDCASLTDSGCPLDTQRLLKSRRVPGPS